MKGTSSRATGRLADEQIEDSIIIDIAGGHHTVTESIAARNNLSWILAVAGRTALEDPQRVVGNLTHGQVIKAIIIDVSERIQGMTEQRPRL